MTTTDLRARRDAAFGAGAALFYDEPLEIVRGDGAFLFDADGRRYVDMYNNVPCVGHANPRVVEAMARQQATLNVHSRYLHPDIIRLAERLAALHGPEIESVVFSCSGTEANEIAIRTAQFATGRRGVICTDATYHGNNALVGALTHVGRLAASPPGVRAFPFPDPFRPFEPNLPTANVAGRALERVDAAIEDLEASGDGVAALIVCSIFANEGLPDIPSGFMAAAAERVRRAGGLVIADEVQAGYGRTGRWWGYEVTGFTPDIVVTGKPMGAGLPLAATAASRKLIETFRSKTRYFNTFAASPLQAAVGLAVLDEIEARGLVANAASVGARLKSELAARAEAWPAIGEVRGSGLFIGLDMVADPQTRTPDPALAATICNALKRQGFLTAPAGANGNVVKIRPPLVFGWSEAEAFLTAFDETVRTLRAG